MNISKCIGIVAGVVGAILFFAFLAYIADPTTIGGGSSSISDDESRAPRHAYLAAREFCRENLKSPRSAQFASGHVGTDSDHTLVASEEWPGMWYAAGVVDAQNSFGGLMRHQWDAYVQRVPQGWKLVYLNIGDQTLGAIPIRPKSETQIAAEQKQQRDREAIIETLRQAQVAAAEQKRIETTRKVVESQLQRAMQGSAQAQYDLALRYLTGDGVELNTDTAIGWLRVAARQKHAPAVAKLESLTQSETIAAK